MHTRLFLGMLPRIPSLLMRRRSQHWAQQQEVKGLWGMRLMLRVWQLLGRKAFTAPAVAGYRRLLADRPLCASGVAAVAGAG